MSTDAERIDPAPTRSPEELLDREAAFWDRQEEVIGQLQGRPHDWRFVPVLGDRITKPKTKFIVDAVTRHGGRDGRPPGAILDIGCGNGWLCMFSAAYGVRSYGVDLSPNKIETARRLADEKGFGELCHFEACDVMDLELPEKVDVLLSCGSLHHLPDLERILPILVERHLRPGGLMLFVEPHHEGMSPKMSNFLTKLGTSRLFGRLFDLEFYQQVSSGKTGVAESETEFDVRGESPAGLEFLGEEPDMKEILTAHYPLVEERYFHYISGHLSNAFYVYMKSRIIRGLWRLVLPLVVRLDSWLCRKPKNSQWAEEGAWLLRHADAATDNNDTPSPS